MNAVNRRPVAETLPGNSQVLAATTSPISSIDTVKMRPEVRCGLDPLRSISAAAPLHTVADPVKACSCMTIDVSKRILRLANI